VNSNTVADVEPLIISPLPRRVRPIFNETIDSYLLRIANANHLHPLDVRSMITGRSRHESKPSPIPAHRLAQLTGITERTLSLALPELAAATDQPLPLGGRPSPEAAVTRPACLRCIGGRPAAPWDAPQVWSLHEDAICCISHRCLYGQPSRSLTLVPEVFLANRRHKRLIRRYGRESVRAAFNDASRFTRQFPAAVLAFEARMDALYGPDWQFRQDDPRHVVATYPETVELTRMFASPYWNHLILDGHMPDDEVSWAELDTVRFTIIERSPGHGFVLRQRDREIAQFEHQLHRAVSPHFEWIPRLARTSEASLAGWVYDKLRQKRNRDHGSRLPEPGEAFT
jgi:hypothetical protein